jgi:hypothetical protein
MKEEWSEMTKLFYEMMLKGRENRGMRAALVLSSVVLAVVVGVATHNLLYALLVACIPSVGLFALWALVGDEEKLMWLCILLFLAALLLLVGAGIVRTICW